MSIYEFQKANPNIFRQLSINDVLFLFYESLQKERLLQVHSIHVYFFNHETKFQNK